MANFKKWTALSILLIAFFSSCNEYYPVEYVYETVYVNSFTRDYTVKAGDWKIGDDDESGPYFYYEFQEKDLTKEIYDYGAMMAFLKMNNDNLSPLPFSDFWYINAYGGYDRAEQVTVEFRTGYITFILKYSDHAIGDDPYYNYSFRVRFMW